MTTDRRPTLTVVICAYTLARWTDVVDGVAAAVDQLGPGDELLLSIDHNDELFRRSQERWSDLAAVRVVENTHRRGLSGARNTAVLAAAGEIIVFLDDDARAAPGALDALRAALDAPDVVGAGGSPEPVWPVGGRPRWFAPELDWTVGCRYVGLPTTVAPVRNPIGAVMALRREVFERVGLFLEGVGRVGSVPLGCEETELAIRYRRTRPAAVVLHVPSAVVHHRVTPERATRRYLLRRGYAEGISKRVISREVGAGASLSTERGYVLRVLSRAVARELGAAARGDMGGLGAALMLVGVLAAAGLGYVRGMASGETLPAAERSIREPVVGGLPVGDGGYR